LQSTRPKLRDSEQISPRSNTEKFTLIQNRTSTSLSDKMKIEHTLFQGHDFTMKSLWIAVEL
jgi:hypothetical protein